MSIVHGDVKNYGEVIREGFVIVDFYSETCNPCKELAMVFDELLFEAPFVTVVKVNISDYPELGKVNDVHSVPTVLYVKDGAELERQVGFMPLEEVKNIVAKYLY